MTLILDLHNHSSYSYDASNRFAHFQKCFERGLFHAVAITDHNTMKGAKSFQNGEFRVIIGVEVDTRHGEIIGLFLEGDTSTDISTERPVFDTAKEIQKRGGLVYLQHPYYRFVRRAHRLHPDTISALLHQGLIDIIETRNAGALMAPSNRKGKALAQHWDIPQGAGSDAHHPSDIGRCTVAIPYDKSPFALTNQELLEGLRAGEVNDSRIRSAATTLSVRVGYAVKVGYGRLAGAEPKRRDPTQVVRQSAS